MNPDPAEGPIQAAVSERQAAGWDLRNAARNYSTLVAAQVAVAAFSFASVWLITRNLGTDGYGGVVAIIAASQIAQIFVNWTGVSLTRYGVEEFVESGKISNSFWARSAIFLPNTFILLLCGPLWLPIVSGWLKLPANAIWLVAAHFAASAVWLHIQQAMQAAKLPRLQGVMLAAERILIFVGLLCLVAAGRLDGLTAIAAYIAAPAVMAIAGLIAIRRLFSWRIDIRLDVIAKLLKFSLPLIPYSLIGYFSTNYLDAIFISQYLTRADLGVYSVAYQINGILLQFPLLAGTLLLPLFITLRSTGKADRVTTYMEDLLPILTLAGGVAALLAALAATFLIPLVFGEQAVGSVNIFWILISSAVLTIPTIVGFAPFTNAVSATYVASALALVSSMANLAGNYFLIPRYGLKGCAWATVLAYGASVLVAVVIVRTRFSIRHTWILPACLPVLTASAYASATGDLVLAFAIGIVMTAAVLIIWQRALARGVRMLKDYRAFVGG